MPRPAAWLAVVLGAASVASATTKAGALPAAPATATAPAPAAAPAPTAALDHLSHGRFHDLAIYHPPSAPKSVALLLSGERGWDVRAKEVARSLSGAGALVVGIDYRQFAKNLDADGAGCVFPDGDLENLSHFIQAYYRLPTYLKPVLVGDSSAASFAYAMAAQSPNTIFGGIISLGFCPQLSLRKPLCAGSGLSVQRRPGAPGGELLPAKALGAYWIALQGAQNPHCGPAAAQPFVPNPASGEVVGFPGAGTAEPATTWLPQLEAAYARLLARTDNKPPPLPPAVLGDLPVVEVPATGDSTHSDRLAIMFSGDGGWAGLDQGVAASLAAQGIPVVGIDSLRYFWTARTPDGIAADTDRLIRYYLAHYAKQRVLLIGYSQGADVLPFALNRLPPATRAHVALAAVLGISAHALFEFHLSSWVSDSNAGPATLPELERLHDVPLLCIYGSDEDDSPCKKLVGTGATVVQLQGGHHFDGDYAGLARRIIAALRP
jgi:type IV secretory pathway VirJ component